MSKITVGLPVYNAEKYIHNAITSILKQSYSDFELIITDDGSKDNSIDIIRQFNDSRITLIEDGDNCGLPYRLNQITSLASGEYIARMDADDIMHVDRLATQLKYMQANPNVDVIGTSIYVVDGENRIIGKRKSMTISEDSMSSFKVVFIHPTIFGRTKWFKSNPYNINALRIEDLELWYRTIDKSTFRNLDTPMLYYRETQGKYYLRYKKAFEGKSYMYKQARESGIKRDIKFYGKLYRLNYVKYYLYRLLDAFNCEKVLLKRRSLKIDDAELNNARVELDKILK